MSLLDFSKDAIYVKDDAGTITISCRLGLWSVSGHDSARVSGEALHYYVQYAQDGEYDEVDE